MDDPLSLLLEDAAPPACDVDLTWDEIILALEPTPLPECFDGIKVQSAMPAEDALNITWNESAVNPVSRREEETATNCVPKSAMKCSYLCNSSKGEGQFTHSAASLTRFAVNNYSTALQLLIS